MKTFKPCVKCLETGRCFVLTLVTWCFLVVFQAWRPRDHAGIFRGREETVAGSSGRKRSCKNVRALFQTPDSWLGSFLSYFLLELVFKLIWKPCNSLVDYLGAAAEHPWLGHCSNSVLIFLNFTVLIDFALKSAKLFILPVLPDFLSGGGRGKSIKCLPCILDRVVSTWRH